MLQNEINDEVDLAHYLDVLLRRRWIVAAGVFFVSVCALLYTFVTRPVFEAQTLLVIEKERGSGSVSSDGSMVDSSNEDYYQTQYKLLKSDSMLRSVYEKLSLDKTQDFAQPHGVEKLDKLLTIEPIVHSRLVYVKADSHDPRLASEIANTIAQTFVEQNLSNQLFMSNEVLTALQTKSNSADADKVYGSLPAVVNNQLIQQLKAEYAKLQSQYADMAARYMPKHPAMLALRSNLAALDGQIKTETAKIVLSLKTDLSGQLKANNVRIVDPALVPDNPIRPKKLLALILGVIVGMAIGLAAAFAVDAIDQTIRTQEDVEQRLAMPFLGTIPLFSGSTERPYEPLLKTDLSLTSEAVRNLRTMVDFASVADKRKIFLVTSTTQGEGKTYTASNLAVAFAQLGERVLIVAGDLRRPSVAKQFRLSRQKGLSDFLASGQSADELHGLLQSTEIPELKALVCGPRPPNPSELLNTPRLEIVVSWARANFDRVIVDCTPMFPIHDTLLWGRHVPSAVFVVRYGLMRTPLIAKAKRRLEEGGIKILGAVVNATKPGGLTYSSYGYYYQQYYHAYQEAAVQEQPS